MMSKKRPHSRREPADLAAARKVASRLVAERWPELAGIEPTVTPRQYIVPPGEVLARAGVAPGTVLFRPDPAVSEYTFTFAAETHTPDGHTLPTVARVTVDSRRRVVKTTISK
jgi:hypothetical protein